MGLYLYCVVPAEHEPGDALLGVDAEPVRSAAVGDLACWVSEHQAKPEVSVARIQQHNAVVEAAITDLVTPVPVRFGQWVESEPRLRAVMGERMDHFRDWLPLFAGALEFGLRALNPEQPPAQVVRPEPYTTGRAYLTALREQMRSREGNLEIRDLIHDEFASLVRAERFEEAQGTHGLLSVAHLVARTDFDAYRHRVRELRERSPHLRFLTSGPWPPYSFAA
jgi:hypothetical protein